MGLYKRHKVGRGSCFKAATFGRQKQHPWHPVIVITRMLLLPCPALIAARGKILVKL